MKEEIYKIIAPCDEDKYRAWYRCSNCGTIFQYDMQKGLKATDMKGICVTCGIKSGTPGVGSFPIVKFNPEYDGMQRHYYK